MSAAICNFNFSLFTIHFFRRAFSVCFSVYLREAARGTKAALGGALAYTLLSRRQQCPRVVQATHRYLTRNRLQRLLAEYAAQLRLPVPGPRADRRYTYVLREMTVYERDHPSNRPALRLERAAHIPCPRAILPKICGTSASISRRLKLSAFSFSRLIRVNATAISWSTKLCLNTTSSPPRIMLHSLSSQSIISSSSCQCRY